MFGDSNGQIKLRAKQKFKFLSATTLASTPAPDQIDLKIIVIKGYFTLPEAPELEPHHQMQSYLSARVTVSVF